MPDTAGATGPKTPPRGVHVVPSSEIKSTPIAVGTAAVSENIGTLGVEVDPWVSRDVEVYKKCEIDAMIEELLYRCRDKPKPDPHKSALLRKALNIVLTVCNDGKTAQDINEFLNHFIEAPDALRSYTYFVGAANTALLQLQKMNVPGIVFFKGDEDMSEILFYHNDHEMYQMHQGEQSIRKPDVVVAPRKAAHAMQEDGDLYSNLEVFGNARKKSEKHFQWRNIRSTVEFKRSKRAGLSKLLKEQPSQNTSKDMVAKVYWPEQSRESEPDILKKVHVIAEKNPDVDGHIPEMVRFHKFDETSMTSIRKILGIDEPDRGSRALYIIVFRKLVPITTLSGKEFLKAWWHVVVCHRILWINGILHMDISPSNLMVYKNANNEWIGVLNDYDLSSTHQGGPSGNERIGTIPFMAIDLLNEEAIEGNVQHLYQHDAESLIWVLAWVCLRYEDGKLRSSRPLDEWLTADAKHCRVNKIYFLLMGRRKAQPSPSHEVAWDVARSCLVHVAVYLALREPTLEDEYVYSTWLEAEVKPRLKDQLIESM